MGFKGDQVTRKSGCRVPGYQNIRKGNKFFDLISRCPDVHYLII